MGKQDWLALGNAFPPPPPSPPPGSEVAPWKSVLIDDVHGKWSCAWSDSSAAMKVLDFIDGVISGVEEAAREEASSEASGSGVCPHFGTEKGCLAAQQSKRGGLRVVVRPRLRRVHVGPAARQALQRVHRP